MSEDEKINIHQDLPANEIETKLTSKLTLLPKPTESDAATNLGTTPPPNSSHDAILVFPLSVGICCTL